MKLKDKKIQIACDGGAATGKSTGAKMIAKRYKLNFLSSGLLYRYASYLLIKHKPENKIIFLKKKFKNLNLNKLKKINLHTTEISYQSAVIAKIYKVRQVLKTFQIRFARKYKNCCIEGRDIATKILPNSNIKFYFVCNLNIASFRRHKELKKNNKKIKLKEVKKALRIRNNYDTKRRISPLLKHHDAIEIDTGKLSKQAMLKKMSKYVDRFIKTKYGN